MRYVLGICWNFLGHKKHIQNMSSWFRIFTRKKHHVFSHQFYSRFFFLPLKSCNHPSDVWGENEFPPWKCYNKSPDDSIYSSLYSTIEVDTRVAKMVAIVSDLVRWVIAIFRGLINQLTGVNYPTYIYSYYITTMNHQIL